MAAPQKMNDFSRSPEKHIRGCVLIPTFIFNNLDRDSLNSIVSKAVRAGGVNGLPGRRRISSSVRYKRGGQNLFVFENYRYAKHNDCLAT